MDPNLVTDRRKFLKIGASGAGALALVSPMARALAAQCGLTPEQTAGPFYPGEQVFHADNDLTRIAGKPAPQGQLIRIRGTLQDPHCRPLVGATIEIWQACASGRYNNPTDDNPAPLDPNFKYWGETVTDSQGQYEFKSIRPGSYPADTDWVRPPHVHFKVSKLGYKELITQLYFKGEALNDKDLILNQIPVAERDSVIIEFGADPGEPDILTGTFDITLEPVRS